MKEGAVPWVGNGEGEHPRWLVGEESAAGGGGNREGGSTQGSDGEGEAVRGVMGK